MSFEEQRIPTWEDFSAFYNNPIIKSLANNRKWTVSDKDKRPIDMYALINYQKVWGLSFERATENGYNPYVTLNELCEALPSATNNAYHLDALVDKIVVLDIEPGCPQELKNKLMGLPYLYGEVSMSGKGIHLIFELPEEIINKYPIAQNKITLMEENGYYEILLCHTVTFTRNALPPTPYTEDISLFDDIFESLCQKAKGSVNNVDFVIDNIDTDSIPNYDILMKALALKEYNKTINDFPKKGTATGVDSSRYEFGISGFYYRQLTSLLPNDGSFNGHTYTDEEKAIIVYKCVERAIQHRDKHDETRNGMPWLLFVAATLIAKTELEKAQKESEKNTKNE